MYLIQIFWIFQKLEFILYKIYQAGFRKSGERVLNFRIKRYNRWIWPQYQIKTRQKNTEKQIT